MGNLKICKCCRKVINLETSASFIGITEGLGRIDVKWYNCHICGTTLAKLVYPEPETFKEALDLIDTICASIEASFESLRKGDK